MSVSLSNVISVYPQSVMLCQINSLYMKYIFVKKEREGVEREKEKRPHLTLHQFGMVAAGLRD